MQSENYSPSSAGGLADYFSNAALPSQQETLGQIALETLREGKSLSRTTLCIKLLARLDSAQSLKQEKHYQGLLRLLFTRGT